MAKPSLMPSVGDIVTLASGGPPMTVQSLENAPASGTPLAPGAVPAVLVRCIWFNPAGAYANALFPAEVLVEAGSSNDKPAPPVSSPTPSPTPHAP